MPTWDKYVNHDHLEFTFAHTVSAGLFVLTHSLRCLFVCCPYNYTQEDTNANMSLQFLDVSA